jgi:hypothetical protein
MISESLWGYITEMNHLPILAMITLAKKGKLNRKFAKLKLRLPVCMSCMFGMAHCKPWHSKGEKGFPANVLALIK